VQTLAGEPFDVRALVQLRGRHPALSEFPATVRNIQIGRRCQRIHVLHGAIATGQSEHGFVGTYIVNYATTDDNTSVVQHVGPVLGEDVLDWWAEPMVSTNNAKLNVAWRGTNAKSQAEGKSIYLYKSTWDTYRPDEAIKSIDFVNGTTVAAPFLIAITVE
jgi:hypothetical protein